MRSVVLGDDERAARVFVEAVNNSRPFLAADSGEIFAVSQQRIHQRMLLMTGAGMNDQARGLVEHEKILVLEQDLERHRLGFRFDSCDFRFTNLDDVARAHRIPRSSSFPIHDHERLADQRLQSRARKRRQRLRQKAIETLAGMFPADFELGHG